MIRLNSHQQARFTLLRAKLKSLPPEQRALELARIALEDPDLADVLCSSLGEPVSLLSLSPGDMLGDYELIELLSSGGFGEVWKAAQHLLRGAKKTRALKFIRADLLVASADHFISRFIDEIHKLAEIKHSHIVALIGDGTVPSGFHGADAPFLVMEYHESSSLSPAPALATDARTRVEFMHTVCDAVDWSHRQGMLHLDLTPNNVRVRTDLGSIGKPIVIDFGLAARLFPHCTFMPELVGTGTPGYMAPEQIDGPGEIGPQTDVHALGVLLFQLLTGKLPYLLREAGGERAKDEVWRATLNQERLPLSRFRTDLPGLEPILAKAMERAPAMRYAAAGDFRDALKAWLEENENAHAAEPKSVARGKSFATDQFTIARLLQRLALVALFVWLEMTHPAHGWALVFIASLYIILKLLRRPSRLPSQMEP